VLALGTLTACGGGSNSIVGQWETGGHEWEFFSDGTMVVGHGWGPIIGDWTADGDRLVISGLRGDANWINGAWTFSVSRNTFTFELRAGDYLEFSRVR